MGDLRRLFVVTKDRLVIGRSNRHKKLVAFCSINEKDVLGGGIHDQKGTHFILFGKSYDFGDFDIDLVKYHIKNKNVYWFDRRSENFTLEIDEERKEKESDRF